MDFELSEEQRAIVDTARAVARDEMMPFARQWDEEEFFPAETLGRAAAVGFGGIYAGADVGGSALSRLDAALIFEELAKGCTSTAAYMSIHNMVVSMIDAYASTELRLRVLPDLCPTAGKHVEFGQLGRAAALCNRAFANTGEPREDLVVWIRFKRSLDLRIEPLCGSDVRS